MFNLIMFGPPGSGKGTQSVKIAGKYNFAHISTGDILRNEIKDKSEMGLKVQAVIERGELVSDEMLLEILDCVLEKYTDYDGLVFDGFPRTLVQAQDLDRMLAGKNRCVGLVLALEVNEEEVVDRLLKRAILQGRKDDTEDVIRNRMSVYRNQTSPLIEYYQQQGKFESVLGVGSVDDIANELYIVIDKYI
jgi:adenylate kinase